MEQRDPRGDDDADEKRKKDFRSSRDALTRSRSSPQLRTSGQALWGPNYDKDDGDKSLQRILKENKARRAPKDEYCALQGSEWRIEGWNGEEGRPKYVYHDTGKLNQAVSILRCSNAVITIANKCSHVMVNAVKNCKVRVAKGVITSIELVHCEHLELWIASPVPVLQIDLSRDCKVIFIDETSRPKIVTASCVGLNSSTRTSDPAKLDDIPCGPFGEQVVTYYVKKNGAWEKTALPADQLKNGAYVELAGIAGSDVDLLQLEGTDPRPPPPH